jgi:hypothetical protein
LPAFPRQPGKALTRDSARELFLHLRSGRSLTLAEYVRAEEVLAASSLWRARTTDGLLSLASEGGTGSALRTGLVNRIGSSCRMSHRLQSMICAQYRYFSSMEAS